MTARRHLLRLTPLVMVGFALGIAVPRAPLVAHVHADGHRGHVHVGADRVGHAADHGHAHAGDHHHGAHHHHGESAAHHRDHHHHDHAEPVALALVVPGDAAHVHWQAPFQRAVPHALPPAIALATAGPTPAPSVRTAVAHPRPASRSRGPPRA